MSAIKSNSTSQSQMKGSKNKSRKNIKQNHRQRQEHYDVKRNTSFTMDEVDEFRQIFDFYDVTHSKIIDFKDLEKSLRSLGYFLSQEELDRLLQLLDVDGDTTLDFSEFCMVIECIKRDHGEFGDLRDSFRFLDHNKDGHVLVEDLVRLITTKGEEEMSQKEITELIEFADKDKSGRINYEQFIEMINKKENENKLNIPQSSSSHVSAPVSRDSTEHDMAQESNKFAKGRRKSKKAIFDNPRSIELVDSVDKAIGGPILLASAIIIKHSQCSTKANKV